MNNFALLSLCAFSLCLGACQTEVAPRAEATPAIDGDTDLEIDVRVYDISTLISPIPQTSNEPDFDLPLANTWSGISSRAGSGEHHNKHLLGIDFAHLIREGNTRYVIMQVKDAAGQPGDGEELRAREGFTLQELHGNLIIRSTPAQHEAILARLDTMHEERGVKAVGMEEQLLIDENAYDVDSPPFGS